MPVAVIMFNMKVLRKHGCPKAGNNLLLPGIHSGLRSHDLLTLDFLSENI
jgi:hypothetical protein